MLRVRLLLLVLVTAFAVSAASATAATITVNTTTDSTGAGVCSLREAISDVDSPGSPVGNCAAAAFGANTIELGPGTYTLGGNLSTSPLSVSATVTTLTIQGSGQRSTIIDAAQLSNTALDVAKGATVDLDELTLTDAYAQNGSVGAGGTGGAAGNGANGGGIYNQGTLVLNYSAVTDSHAGDGGVGGAGGSAQQGGAGGNGGDGGGIYNTGNLTLNGATLSGDQAGAGGAGGAGGANPTAVGGKGGVGGYGGFGGGLENADGSVTITGSTFSGNGSGAGGAGGIGGAGATTGGAGGTGGQATAGGGLNSDGNTGSVTITNSTFASDTAGTGGVGGGGGTGTTVGGAGGAGGAGGGGGAINVFPGSLNLQSDTIAGNSTGAGAPGGSGGTGPTAGVQGAVGNGAQGGGLGEAGTATLQNTLLASNSGGNCGGVTIIDAGHNLSFGDTSCPGTFASGDPNLGALQLNGGATETISLGAGSAALGRIPTSGAGCPATDQRGVARPGITGDGCDIGAYEVAPPTARTGPATLITTTTARLASTVTANAGTTAVTFDYGTTTKYGKTKNVSGIMGVSAVPAVAAIKGLAPGTTYHYRVVVTTIDGSATGTDRTFKTAALPAISRLGVSRSGQSVTIGYRDSKAATTTLRIRKGSKTIATITHHDKAGSNQVKLTIKHLGKGRYEVRATPRFDRQNGSTVTATFSVT